MSYTVIITEEISANVDVTTQNYPITIEYNATNITAGGSYGNANVATFLASYGSNTLSTTGNVTAGYFLGDGSQLTNLPPGNYSNANVSAFLAAFGSNTISTTGNITGGNFVGSGAALTSLTGANVSGTVANATYATSAGSATTAGTVTANAQANITSVGTLTSLAVSGNVQANNVNATNYVSFGTAGAVTAAATGQMFWDTTEQTVSLGMNNGVTQQIGLENYILVKASATITNGQVVMFTGANGDNVTAAPADVTAVGFRPGYVLGVATQDIALNAFGYITSFGKVRGLNTNAYTVGDLLWLSTSTPGAMTTTQPSAPNYQVQVATVTKKSAGDGQIQIIIRPEPKLDDISDVAITTPANGQVLTWTTGNVWVNSSINAANITGTIANATYALNANAATYASVATFADTANAVAGANVSGTVANATYATSAGSATTATTAGTVTDAAQANITSVGTLTSLSVSGNVTASYFLGNGSQLTGLPAGYSNADVSTYLASGTNSANIVTTANVQGAVLKATGNLTSTQQTVIGTANVGTTGNIVISGKNIATDMAWSPDGGNAATAATGRIVIGTGWAGNITYSTNQNRLAVSDAITRTNTGTGVRALTSEQFVSLAGNVTNGSFRQQTLGGYLRIGGGSAANTISLSAGAGNIFSVAGAQFNLDVGNVSPYNLGNTTISHAAVNGGSLNIQAGSTVLNAYGINNLISAPIGGSAGNVGNIIGYSTGMALGTVPSGNVYAFYHGNGSSGTATGVPISNTIRQAPQYYAFYNADDHAQVQLGSLKSYNEFRYDTATSGTVDISKLNGQVQYIRPTGNVTIGSLTNFVTETTDGSTYDQQIDTVTLVVAQGATPYTITMPTGNAQIKYAGGTSTVGATANAVSMISISAANIASVKTYMVTISPEFS